MKAISVLAVAFVALLGLAQETNEDAMKWAKRYFKHAGYDETELDQATLDAAATRIDKIAEWCDAEHKEVAGMALLTWRSVKGDSERYGHPSKVLSLYYRAAFDLYEREDQQTQSRARCVKHAAKTALSDNLDVTSSLPPDTLYDPALL